MRNIEQVYGSEPSSEADFRPFPLTVQSTDGFANFAPSIRQADALRQSITTAYRRPEMDCLEALIPLATLPDAVRDNARRTAKRLVETIRANPRRGGVEGLVQEYELSSDEGVALMCLAEALLRVPDKATRMALVRDKIGSGNWQSHLGDGRSLFVNAATWGLVVTGKLVSTVNERGLGRALARLVSRAGEPVILKGVDVAIRLLGEQFVTGETIQEAIRRGAKMEAKGFTYSFDMLGEAAMTAEDAARYYADYENAILAIGEASGGRGPIAASGISIKLSALHPRYVRSQADRVMGELLPRVKQLAVLAKSYNIGINIDAEEADRLELSLDLLESLALDPDLAGWNGLGFVVQAYGKRCPFVIDWIIDLSRRAGRRMMVRLVKGAYWDAEIKRAQVDGLEDFPVYTRKLHTDVAYIACARKLLSAPDAVFPQFATHNAQTMATIYHMAGEGFAPGDYEFQCLHGMGEPLYEQVVGADKLDRPCRIYAPVGSHDTLLAYLVRRLLENGANSSFVNRIGDPEFPVEDLVQDPVALVASQSQPGSPHEQIALPSDIYDGRRNSGGIDLSNEAALADLAIEMRLTAQNLWQAFPASGGVEPRYVLNPADHDDIVGQVSEIAPDQATAFVERAKASRWLDEPVANRAAMLETAADIMQARMPQLMGVLVREAGKSAANAIAEVREAVDFLRYYAEQARGLSGDHVEPLGPIVCISPWNFPLAIFTGQVAAALAAGNSVLAKPAEETPLIAAEAVRILHKAGIPEDALQFVPGDGAVGAALINAPSTAAVMFTGSTEVARLIQSSLAGRVSERGEPLPLIAETGGMNAMMVDSTALSEQVVGDVIISAFDSAGQRCSALRILCLQEEIADRTLVMLKGALREMCVGNTDQLANDIGPVITAEAQANIEAHIAAMAALGHTVERCSLDPSCSKGTFVAPTIIELDNLDALNREVFGPVLHVIRYRRKDTQQLIDRINGKGYGLTFGLHTRLDETIAEVSARVKAGNLYVNRNMVGAVVGLQPFGGQGLSGTGPKAGGPLYLRRLMRGAAPLIEANHPVRPSSSEWIDWLEDNGAIEAVETARLYARRSALGLQIELAGPVGERNIYSLEPRGLILVWADSVAGMYNAISAVLATGGTAAIRGQSLPENLPEGLALRIIPAGDAQFASALVEGDAQSLPAKLTEIAAFDGPIVPVHAPSVAAGSRQGLYNLDLLLDEVSLSINTTAAGGNASLMSLD